MKQFFTMLFLLAPFAPGYGQSLSPQVIASGGQYAQNGTVDVAYTIGEVVTETFSSGSEMLTQGFQQPEFVITSLDENPENGQVNIYPNPFTESVSFAFSSLPDGNYRVMMLTAGGQVLSSANYQVNGDAVISINMQQFADAVYFVHITDPNGKHINTSKIIKTTP